MTKFKQKLTLVCIFTSQLPFLLRKRPSASRSQTHLPGAFAPAPNWGTSVSQASCVKSKQFHKLNYAMLSGDHHSKLLEI